ncbi:unnamed protein product [Pylaiella littoralis]
MSSKIAKRMMSRVEDMVSRASSATKGADLPTSKRKAAKRALLQAPLKRKRSSNAGATKSGRSVSKNTARNKTGRKPAGLLEQARRELRGKSRVARNVSLLSYNSGGGGQATGAGGVSGGVAKAGGGGGGVVSKSRKAVEHLLQRDTKKRGGRIAS